MADPLGSLVCCVFLCFCHFPYVPLSTSELRVSLVPLNMFKPSSIFFTDHSKAVLLFVDRDIYASHLSLLCCLVYFLQHCTKELTSWPCVMFSCVFVTFQYGVSGQVWYLIVLISELFLLLYFDTSLCSISARSSPFAKALV